MLDGQITPDAAAAFAQAWIAAWNAHDLPAILAHYADEVAFRSPRARLLTGEGLVGGRAALEAYWRRALEAQPALRFELCEVVAGDGALTILYRNHRGQHAAETFEFGPDGKVVRAYACYR